MGERVFRVHGCGLTARFIHAESEADAARLFQFNVNREKFRGKSVKEGEIVVKDERGTPHHFSWELKPL